LALDVQAFARRIAIDEPSQTAIQCEALDFALQLEVPSRLA
jgi:hypothetical protein